MRASWKSVVAVTMIMVSSSLFAAVNIGDKAPDFKVQDTQGKQRSLSEFAGKTVILEWTNPECPFVKKHYGSQNIQKQQADATRNGVVWLSINSSAKGKEGHLNGAQAKEIEAKWKAAPTAYLLDEDGKVGRLYGAKTTPHMYIVDSQGILRYNGAIDSVPSTDESDIAKAKQYVSIGLSELAAGKPITTSVSQPYGCGVKY